MTSPHLPPEPSRAPCRPETGAHQVYNGTREWHEPCPRHQPAQYAARSAASGGARHKSSSNGGDRG